MLSIILVLKVFKGTLSKQYQSKCYLNDKCDFTIRSLDRMSGDFFFTCPVVQYAEAFIKTDHSKK